MVVAATKALFLFLIITMPRNMRVPVLDFLGRRINACQSEKEVNMPRIPMVLVTVPSDKVERILLELTIYGGDFARAAPADLFLGHDGPSKAIVYAQKVQKPLIVVGDTGDRYLRSWREIADECYLIDDKGCFNCTKNRLVTGSVFENHVSLWVFLHGRVVTPVEESQERNFIS